MGLAGSEGIEWPIVVSVVSCVRVFLSPAMSCYSPFFIANLFDCLLRLLLYMLKFYRDCADHRCQSVPSG